MIVRVISFILLIAIQNASTIKKKRFIPKKYDSDVPLVVTSTCSLDQTLLEQAMGYEFIDQYTDQSGKDGGVTLSQFAEAQRGHQLYSYNKSYYCPEGNTGNGRDHGGSGFRGDALRINVSGISVRQSDRRTFLGDL